MGFLLEWCLASMSRYELAGQWGRVSYAVVQCVRQAEELATAAAAAAAAIAESSSAASSDNEQAASANGGDGALSLGGRRGKRKPQRTRSAPSMAQLSRAERRPHSPSPLSRPPLDRCVAPTLVRNLNANLPTT